MKEPATFFEKIVSQTQAQWQEAKKMAAERYRLRLPELADKLDNCKLFKGTESLGQLAELIFSPQGREFMTDNSFPDLETFRRFLPYSPDEFDIYIDKGELTLINPDRCMAVGSTHIKVECNEVKATKIILMHGAEADIEATGNAVVKVEKDNSSQVRVTTRDNAKVL